MQQQQIQTLQSRAQKQCLRMPPACMRKMAKTRSAQDTIDTRIYRSRRCASLDASYGTLAHTAMECRLALCLAQCLQAHAHNHADGMTCRRAAPKSGGLAPSKQGAASS
ncbi:hypothetical protein XAC3810_280091 [Xanthomonas citri pv. citri]|uniref:Uncharacterized protein n=1 Tax=Xanthomonas citri pv. citri TaxID=611301 RepID=A0A0U5FG12_XANCI|nr:hypothetical protein XAC3824_280141 [Xanthomonas citri pv. citri]CEE23156.1 hypothetical protein XAC9322_280099 [Xanthomonas citri pv. citri]CEE24744.1 hypothetical protein XAC1083_270091 [Xanthomonas citri pv. citri]CEE33279.1 hypothetical protein XAC3810_280091 [Xanthomonas citri pv. citri]CEE35524.1 hypothetical protein XAC902_330193 [Xanthomonas citri pv. citri]